MADTSLMRDSTVTICLLRASSLGRRELLKCACRASILFR